MLISRVCLDENLQWSFTDQISTDGLVLHQNLSKQGLVECVNLDVLLKETEFDMCKI